MAINSCSFLPYEYFVVTLSYEVVQSLEVSVGCDQHILANQNQEICEVLAVPPMDRHRTSEVT